MKNFIKNNWFKVLVICILVGAFWSHPYSYYQVLRWVVAIVGAYSAYEYNQARRIGLMWLFIAVTILFNPIFPIYFSKDTWQILDVVGAIVFFVSLFFKKKN